MRIIDAHNHIGDRRGRKGRTGFHTCKHIAVLVVASPVRMAEEEEITKE